MKSKARLTYVISAMVLWSGFAIGLISLSPLASQAQKSVPAAQLETADTNGQLVSIDFNNVDIGVFIKFISDLTKKNFVIDERVRGKVTIISPGKITVDEAFRVFESVLEVHGFATVPSGEIIKILPAPEARSKNIKTRLQEESGITGDTVVTQIIRLRYADPEQIKQLFTPLISKSSVILSYSPTNTLIVTDVASNLKRLTGILKTIDVNGVGQQISIIPVEFADATKLVTVLTTIFKGGQKGAPRAPQSQRDVVFVADERTNAIVLLASEAETENIRNLIKSLDKETPKDQAKIHVYYLEHATAEDVAKVLQDIPQKSAAARTSPAAADKSEGVVRQSTPVISDKVRITADKATNSLIIMADQEEYVTIQNILRKIDIPRAMVYIEALIMEVNVSKDFRLGTEWILGGEASYNDKEGVYGGGFSGGATGGDPGYSATAPVDPTSGTRIPLLPPGLALGLFGENIEVGGITFPSISAVIQAYKKDRDVRILSTPQILTTDNQEAKIYVGKNIPFQTTATATSTGNEVYNSFEYKDVGKTLKITPQISKDRMVRLVLSLEVSALESMAEFRPTTLKRTVETTAIVKDGATVVLGGLIDDSIANLQYKVPCLGDIPLLGYAFRSTGEAGEKSNLYVFLTPKVIQNPDEAKNVSVEKRHEIDTLREKEIKLYPKDDDPQSGESGSNSVLQFQYSESRQTDPVDNQSTAAANKSVQSEIDQPETRDVAEEPVIEEKAAAAPAETTKVETSHGSGVGRTPQDHAVQPTDSGKKAAPTATGSEGFTIQVASVQDVESANALLQELSSRGFPGYIVRTEANGQIWFRLRVGFFIQRPAAAETMDRLRGHHYKPILIKI